MLADSACGHRAYHAPCQHEYHVLALMSMLLKEFVGLTGFKLQMAAALSPFSGMPKHLAR